MGESDESQCWLELLTEISLGQATLRGLLLKEAGELTAIFTTAFYDMPA